ncbi:MAG: riboflavin synthase [Acidimicrobiia bacterium]
MFTGIVEQVGTITAVVDDLGLRTIEISGSELGELAIGASIAINGVCLTAVETGGDYMRVNAIPETLHRTNLGQLLVGDRVNLELPMPASGRFDGHIVQGHIDGVGIIRSVSADGESSVVEVETPGDLLVYVVEKGSITVDGVSLTVAGLFEGGFSVALIPHTLEVTTLGLRKAGDPVNLEVDVLAKYVERLMKAHR